MFMKIYLTSILVVICGLLLGQDIPVMPVKDGVYMEANALLKGVPDYAIDALESSLYISEEDGYARAVFNDLNKGEALLPLIFCINNECYKRDEERQDGKTGYYAHLIEVGALCVYKVRRTYREMVTIKAYNPATGTPFREGQVPRTREIEEWMMWRVLTDETRIISPESFREWTGLLLDWNQDASDLLTGIRRYNRIRIAEQD
jgi:hypothetical protein